MTPRAFLTALLLGSSALAAPQPDFRPVQGELRALWVDAFGPGIKTPAEITKLVADAKRMNVNALFAQIGRRFDCYCNNAAMPRTDDPDVPAGFDSLADLLEKAHKEGIQVHAWIITTAMWNNATAPKDPKHTFNLHGPSTQGASSWLGAKFDGVVKGGNDWYADPGHPAAADYIVSMYTSIVKNYDVDGVQFDRVRYPDFNETGRASWGYNPVALERFRQETGFVGTPSIGDESWLEWRRQQVTNLVRRVLLEVKAIKPEVWVSADTITYGAGPADFAAWRNSRTYREVLQDWATWTREGYLDLNVMMNYKRDFLPDQSLWFDQWNAFGLRSRANRYVISGTAIYLNPQDSSVNQIRKAQQAGMDGWAGYSYRTPDVDVNAAKRKGEEVLPELTARLTAPGAPFEKPSSWGKPDTRGLHAISGRVTGEGPLGGRTVEVYSGDVKVRRTQTDANGYYGFVILPLGPLELRIEGAEPLEVTPEFGKVNVVPNIAL